MQNPFRYFKSSPATIQLAVMMYVRFPLSLRQVEELLSERGIAPRSDECDRYAADQTCRRWLNNQAEDSHQPFRRRERTMAKCRDMKALQKFAAAHASIHNDFNHARHLNRRDIVKQNRSAALAEWRQLAA